MSSSIYCFKWMSLSIHSSVAFSSAPKFSFRVLIDCRSLEGSPALLATFIFHVLLCLKYWCGLSVLSQETALVLLSNIIFGPVAFCECGPVQPYTCCDKSVWAFLLLVFLTLRLSLSCLIYLGQICICGSSVQTIVVSCSASSFCVARSSLNSSVSLNKADISFPMQILLCPWYYYMLLFHILHKSLIQFNSVNFCLHSVKSQQSPQVLYIVS